MMFHSLITNNKVGLGLTMFGLFIFAVTAKAQDAGLQDAGLVDIAGSVGISTNAPSYGAYVADYNLDGRQDFLYNGDWRRPMRLFRNVGGRFVVDATTDFGRADRLHCAWGDPNQDGRPDFYCSVGAVFGTAPAKANQLWIQQSDGRFIDQAALWGVTDPYGRGRAVVWLNYNGDRYPDLFVGNEFPRVDGRPTPNRLFVNQGGSSFVEAPIAGLTEEFGGYAAHAADLNRSGYDDLLVAGRQGRLMVYQNQQGNGYRDVSSTLRLRSTQQDVTTADVTGNGYPDIILIQGRQVCVFENRGSWQFGVRRCYGSDVRRVVAVKTGAGGALDIYAARRGISPNNLPDLFLRNNGRGVFEVFSVNASTNQGNANRVQLAAIDHNGDGRDGVLVVNAGGGAPGPLELMDIAGAP